MVGRHWQIALNPGVRVFYPDEHWIAMAREQLHRHTTEDTFEIRTSEKIPHERMVVALLRDRGSAATFVLPTDDGRGAGNLQHPLHPRPSLRSVGGHSPKGQSAAHPPTDDPFGPPGAAVGGLPVAPRLGEGPGGSDHFAPWRVSWRDRLARAWHWLVNE